MGRSRTRNHFHGAFVDMPNDAVAALAAQGAEIAKTAIVATNMTIKWLNINMIWERRVKPMEDIKLIGKVQGDTHYVNRPRESSSYSLHEFTRWFDIVQNLNLSPVMSTMGRS